MEPERRRKATIEFTDGRISTFEYTRSDEAGDSFVGLWDTDADKSVWFNTKCVRLVVFESVVK